MSFVRGGIAWTAAIVMLMVGVTAPASAATSGTAGPVVAGLTITPSVTAVGATSIA